MGALVFSLAISLLILTVFATIYAAKGNPTCYWYAALGIYSFSFLLAGLGIGIIIGVFTFVLLTLAISYSFGWITKKKHLAASLCSGIL